MGSYGSTSRSGPGFGKGPPSGASQPGQARLCPQRCWFRYPARAGRGGRAVENDGLAKCLFRPRSQGCGMRDMEDELNLARPRGRSDRTKGPSRPPAVSSPVLAGRPSEPAAPLGEALRGAGKRLEAAAALRAVTAPTPPTPGPAGSAPGNEPRPSTFAPPSLQTGEDPGCYLLWRTESPPFLLRPRPLPNLLRVLHGLGRVSLSLGWLERPPALSRAAGDGARRLSGSRRGDVGLTSSAAGLPRSVPGGSWCGGRPEP